MSQTDCLWKLSFTVTRPATEIFSETLEEAFHPEATAVSMTELDEKTALWSVEAYYHDEPVRAVIDTMLVVPEELTGEKPQNITIEQLPPTDWVTKSQQGLHPIITDRFFLHGSHDAGKCPVGKMPLLIDAGMAFGTGHHPTTHGCLNMIEKVTRRRKFQNMLDLGCGAGVLAIALAKLTGRTITASDIDPISVDVTRENARFNATPNQINAITAKGFDHPTLRAQAPFDLIVANILAQPLCDLSATLSHQITYDGEIILSGILQEQANMVLAAYRLQGLYLRDRINFGDWVILNLAPNRS